VVRRDGTLDTLHLRVEGEVDADHVAERLKSALGVTVSVSVEPRGSLPRSEGGKLARTVDERTL
jgi:phenylacetate-coenzyme A ligase PaaK-like adenylate-forming protein